MSQIEVGSVVRINSEEAWFRGECAEVVLIKDDDDEEGPIRIIRIFDDFRRKTLGLSVEQAEEYDLLYRFHKHELVVLDDWPIEAFAERMFPNMHHSVGRLKFAFSPKNMCMSKDCEEKAVKRIIINIWGTVLERDVCKAHTKYHGMCMEEFPMSNDYSLVEDIPITEEPEN